MKKSALILVFVLILALGGCTNRNTAQEEIPDTSTMEPEDNTTERPEEDILGDGVTPDMDMDMDEDSLMDDEFDVGVPYDEMLDNGYVHDTDGDLTDGENSKSEYTVK